MVGGVSAERKPVPGWLSAIIPLMTLAVGAGIAWGISQGSSADHERRLGTCESKIDTISTQSATLLGELRAIRERVDDLRADVRALGHQRQP